MKITTIIISFLILSAALTYGQNVRSGNIKMANETGLSYAMNTAAQPIPFNTYSINPQGTVPLLTTFADYVTNGNNLRKVWVFGDTVIVSGDYKDSAAALNTRTIRYNVSYNGGTTWGTDILVVSSTVHHAYGDMNGVILTGGRSVAISGRQYSASSSRAFAGTDLTIGIGVFGFLMNPAAGQDYFSMKLSGSELGGVYRSNDSLFFTKYNYITNTFGSPLLIATSPDFDASGRSSCAISTNGQNVTAFGYLSAAPEKYIWRESSNAGTSFGPLSSVAPSGTIIDGDTVLGWPSFDVIYKPNTTTKCAALQMLPVTSGNRKGYKLVFWSPGINSGNPVTIADYRSSTIPLLYDSTLFLADTGTFQINMTHVTHPSLAYTDDGSRLICAFCVAQPQTSSYGYNYFDIYSSYSDNNGATWSVPVNLTHTASLDEIYVSMSKTGNSSNNVGMVFQVSECPGSSSFNQTGTPQCPVYWVYRRYDPVTGNLISVKTISNEVPKHYSLQQNYPNPFNPSTKIKFEMPKNGYVTLNVYDELGKLVSTIVDNEYVTAGVKEISFEGTNLASGVYFYTLKSGDFSDTKKMMLIK